MSLRAIDAVPPLPSRRADANKGDVGKVLVIGGARGMSGAPCLAARAAYRSGAGLVRVAVPKPIWDVAAAKLEECLTVGLSATESGHLARDAAVEILQHGTWASVVIIGPGMGQEPQTSEVIRTLVGSIDRPMVLDADGLNAFRQNATSQIGDDQRRMPNRPLVLTPHPGEMARLIHRTVRAVQEDRVSAVTECQKITGGVVILKGAGTLVCDGERLYTNQTGNPGMATGGTGDVLAGLIGGLMGQGMSAFDAACLGTHLHGAAGDLAAARLGEWSMLANDLLDDLPRAFLAHAKNSGG